MPSFHQAEHLAGHAAHLQRFQVEGTGERIQRLHDVGNRAVAVQVRSRRGSFLRLAIDRRIRLLDHLLAEIHAHQIVLENIVVEHVFGSFAEVDDPFPERGRPHAESHVLRVRRTGRMVIAADSANAAGDEVRVPRILALHENAVPAKDGRGAMTLGDLAIIEVNLRKNSQAADDPA